MRRRAYLRHAMLLFRTLFVALAALIVTFAMVSATHAQPPAPAPAKAAPRTADLKDGNLTVHVRDVSPRFLAFYEAAKAAPDAEARYRIWKETYDFAAVPPGPQGEAMARRLLDAAWPRYGEAVAPAKAGWAAMQPAPMPVLAAVAKVLELDEPAEMQLVTYIGGFEDNAYTFRSDKHPVLVVPLESPVEFRNLVMAHEGTHAIHMLVGKLAGGWERSVAAVVIQEGLALHVVREIQPGRPLASYVEHKPGWFAASQAKQRLILEDLKTKLAKSDSGTVMGVTMFPAAATGLDRQAYYGGWVVVEQMRKDGLSLAQIARIPEADMPAAVGKAIDHLLAAPPAAN